MRKRQCIRCTSPVGPRSKIYCEYHAGYHNGHSTALMKAKRTDPQYQEHERATVRLRMRKLRATPGYERPDS